MSKHRPGCFIGLPKRDFRTGYTLPHKIIQLSEIADNIDNFIIEHLRVIRADIGVSRNDIADLMITTASREEPIAGMRRDFALLHADIAVAHKHLDHLDERLGRIPVVTEFLPKVMENYGDTMALPRTDNSVRFK